MGKVNPNSARSLKAKLKTIEIELNAARAALCVLGDEHLAATQKIDTLQEGVTAHMKEAKFWHGKWEELDGRYRDAQEQAQQHLRERDMAREAESNLKWTLLGVERERDVARALAEAMREQAFPAPEFPWERGLIISGERQRVGQVEHEWYHASPRL